MFQEFSPGGCVPCSRSRSFSGRGCCIRTVIYTDSQTAGRHGRWSVGGRTCSFSMWRARWHAVVWWCIEWKWDSLVQSSYSRQGTKGWNTTTSSTTPPSAWCVRCTYKWSFSRWNFRWSLGKASSFAEQRVLGSRQRTIVSENLTLVRKFGDPRIDD